MFLFWLILGFLLGLGVGILASSRLVPRRAVSVGGEDDSAKKHIHDFVDFWATHIATQLSQISYQIGKDFHPSCESFSSIVSWLKQNIERWRVFQEDATTRLVKGTPQLETRVKSCGVLVKGLEEIIQRAAEAAQQVERQLWKDAGGNEGNIAKFKASRSIHAERALKRLQQELDTLAQRLRST